METAMTRGPKEIVRFTVNERLQHLVLMVCMVLLMITGLALRFADTWFGQVVIAAEGGIEARGLLHRIAAGGLMILCLHHILYTTFTERGHGKLMAILPRLQDFRDLVQTLRQSLGSESQPPRFEHFDFRQKFQYWALAVGVVTMSLTGLVLWFESISMTVMPKWVIDATQASHSGEGLVIFLVLFVQHLYDTHLRPGVFPMDWSWVNGRISVEDLSRRHGREYERLYGTSGAGPR